MGTNMDLDQAMDESSVEQVEVEDLEDEWYQGALRLAERTLENGNELEPHLILHGSVDGEEKDLMVDLPDSKGVWGKLAERAVDRFDGSCEMVLLASAWMAARKVDEEEAEDPPGSFEEFAEGAGTPPREDPQREHAAVCVLHTEDGIQDAYVKRYRPTADGVPQEVEEGWRIMEGMMGSRFEDVLG